MIKDYIEKIIDKHNLTIDESQEVMGKIMNGEVSNSQLAAFLVALKFKGEAPEEVAGFAKAMREKSIKIVPHDDNIVDVCGTGGDNSGTFNISTAAAFVVAGTGVKVAKHGNKSISSNSGSADVLKELGVKIVLSPKESERALNDIGIAFLFAPIYHPAMKHAAPVRKELRMGTVFNMLGPLTNPAGTKRQLIGTFNDRTAKLLSEAAKYLDYDKVCFICAENKYDEILLRGTTKVFEYDSATNLKEYELKKENFDLPKASLSTLLGKDPKTNAKMVLQILHKKEKDHPFNVVVANSAMALYASDFSNDLIECKNAAEESILSGKAFEKLEELRRF